MVDIMWNPLGSAIGFEEVINNHLKIMGEVCQNIGCVFRLEGLINSFPNRRPLR